MGQILKGIQKHIVSAAVFLQFGSAMAVVTPLPAELDRIIKEGTRLIYQEKFTSAEKLLNTISRKWPQHPAGPFFKAVVLDARMYHFRNADQEREFFDYCDRAIRLGEKKIKANPSDLWAKFFIGGAYGYKGTYESRYKRWISAFRNGFEGVGKFKEIAATDKTIVDIGMGMGTYHYWRSKLMKTLWWMPGVDDKREEGIQILRKTMERAVYTKEAAANNLMWILMEEKRYADALIIAERMLATYPDCRLFLLGKAKSHFHLKQWQYAEKAFRYVLDTAEASPKDNHYNAVFCRLHLGRIYYSQKRYYRAAAECRRILGYPLSKKIGEQLKDMTGEAAKLLKKCQRYYQPEI